MKKTVTLLSCIVFLIILCFVGYRYITNLFSSTIELDKTEFKLKYSTCSPNSEDCINEYYKSGENNTNWTEKISLNYIKDPNYHQFARDIKNNNESAFWIENRDGYDMINFYVFYNEKTKSIVEHNVAKVMKTNKDDGSVSMNYISKVNVTGADNKVWRAKMLTKARKISKELRSAEAPDILKIKITMF